MFWLIVRSYSDSDSDSDRNIRYICLDQYWVSVLSVHTIFYSVSSRVTGTIGDTMWQELTFCFLYTYYMICFVSKYAFEYSELLRIYVMLSWYIVLWNLWIMIYVLNKRRLAIFFCIDRPSMLEMALLTELTAHPSSLLFAD